MNAIMEKNAIIEVVCVLRLSFPGLFLQQVLWLRQTEKNGPTTDSWNGKIEIRGYGLGQVSTVKHKHS